MCKINKCIIAVLIVAAFSSCGNNTELSSGIDSIEEAVNDKDMQKKMNIYVDALNSVSKNLNNSLIFYEKNIDKTTGTFSLGDYIYFSSVIKNAEEKIAAIEKAAQETPAAAIDQYANDYIVKARTALLLHNDLAAYYDTKENLIDKNAKGVEKHAAYLAALTEFKAISDKMRDAYNAYYKMSNAKYIAGLEKNGDYIRVAANKLMNAAEILQDAFYDALENNPEQKATPELEAVMKQTSDFQHLIEDYKNIVNGMSKEQLRKRFLGVDGRVVDFGEDANDMMGTIRSAIAKLQNGEKGIDHEYRNLNRHYDAMIQNFNFCKF